MSAAGLIARLDSGDPRLRLADVRWSLTDQGRGRRDYMAGHIPGALFIDLEADLSARHGAGRHPLPDPVDLAQLLGARGIGSEHTVVAYDDAGGSVAARLWWMLDSLGHTDVHVLDGGIPAYVAAGGRLSTDLPSFEPGQLALAPRWRRTIDRDALRDRLGEVTLLDARAAERYRGEVEPVDAVAGHIPTARSAPAGDDVSATGHSLPTAVLRRRYAALGVGTGAGGRPTVVSCGSGVTACRTALALRVAGLSDPLLYPGSYSDWSKEGLPVVTTADQGELR